MSELSLMKRLIVDVKPMRRVTVMPSEYCCHKVMELAEFIRKTKNIFKVDEVFYSTDSYRMLFAQQYLTGDTATRWRQHCEKHPDASWSHMKML